VPPVRLGPTIGLIVQVVLLATLGVTLGLGQAGWIAGTGYALALTVLLTRAAHRAGIARLGPADKVTLARATLVGCVTALTADSFIRAVPVALFTAITIVALVLDAVDGLVARRTHSTSGFGGRFDMEVDAYLIGVLCVYVAPSAGLWVLAIGAMRYVYVAVSWVMPWTRRRLPPRYWRKVVAAVQAIVLLVVSADVVGEPWETAALLIALALLTESFGRDLIWLWRARRTPLPKPGVDIPGAAKRPEPVKKPAQAGRV